MTGAVRTMAGYPSAELSQERWASYTDLAMGIAPGMRDRRIFLVGDVSTRSSPNGGKGMNTGIADGYDLGWKLAAHLQHGAPERLLDTYSTERHALRAALQKTQYATLKYTTLKTCWPTGWPPSVSSPALTPPRRRVQTRSGLQRTETEHAPQPRDLLLRLQARIASG